MTGGDGGYCFIDNDNSNRIITSFTGNSYCLSTDGINFNCYASSAGGGRFINPSDYDDTNNFLYSAAGLNNILRWSTGFTSSSIITVAQMNGLQASHIKVSPNTPSTIYVATGTTFDASGNSINAEPRVIKIVNANTGAGGAQTDITANLSLTNGTYISCVEVQQGNENHILLTLSSYGLNSRVYETTDGGNTWISVGNNMLDFPVRWAIFDPNNPDRALLATELGVFATTDLAGLATQWFPVNPNTANTRIDMLVMRPADKMLIAATHGRGLFMIDAFASHADFTATNTILYKSLGGQKTPLNLLDLSVGAVSWAWDFNNDGTTDSNIQSPQGVCYYGPTVKLTITTASGATFIKTRNPAFNSCTLCVGTTCPGKNEDELLSTNANFRVYPNPISDHATISYNVSDKNNVSINIFNLEGKLVRPIVAKREQEAGEYSYDLDREGLPVGMYICVLKIGDKKELKKIIIQ